MPYPFSFDRFVYATILKLMYLQTQLDVGEPLLSKPFALRGCGYGIGQEILELFLCLLGSLVIWKYNRESTFPE